jgi:hypothetical protein
MGDDKHNDDQNLFGKLIAVLLRQSWPDVLGDVGKIVRRVVQSWSYKGMYEVLEYEATLELEDPEGKRATFKKREKVRYLQDNIIAYQDQAWGDGEILVDYRCSPGTAVDRYRSGYKTKVVAALGGYSIKTLFNTNRRCSAATTSNLGGLPFSRGA